MGKTMVIAIGGNAINKSDQKGTLMQQFENVNSISGAIADLIEEGYQVVITHGNGPQVGILMVKNEVSKELVPAYPLELCGAQTSGSIGYIIQQCLQNRLREKKINRQVVTVLTESKVSLDDPAFHNPQKPIGCFYSKEESKEMEKQGFVMVEDSGRGWRRVVPSPVPIAIIQQEAVKTLSDAGYIVVCVGGGGIPVVEENGCVHGVDAVIDKDRASALLAGEIRADYLVLLTGVEQVAIDYGKPSMRSLSHMSLAEVEKYLNEGQFPPGSMGPKMESARDFVRNGPKGAAAVVTSLEKLREAMRRETGTWVEKE